MSGYEWFYQDGASDSLTALNNINTGINKLLEKQPSRIVKSKVLVLDSSSKDANSTNANPTFTLPTPITCATDEYIQLTVLRWNGYHDWVDIPANSQIVFTKTGQAPITITLQTYGKPPINNLATAIYNRYISTDSSFNIVYNQNLGSYIITFGVATTMTVLTPELAKYMNVAYNTPIASTNNQIITSPLRPQKTINVALCVGGVSPHSSGIMRSTSGALINKNVLCHIPILSNSFILANYRSYVENEQALRVTDTNISSLTFQYVDTNTGQQVPVAETCLTLEANIYKV